MYVLDTIQSILDTTSQTDRARVVVVVFLTDFDVAYNSRLSAAIVERYGRHIESGLIHVVQVARDVYPPLDGLKRNFNDAKERVYWRAKQVSAFGSHYREVSSFRSSKSRGVECYMLVSVRENNVKCNW